MENWKEELYHYGVAGMKWGVWNDETRARRMGSKLRARNFDRIEKTLKKAKEAGERGNYSKQAILERDAFKSANRFVSKDAAKRRGIFSNKKSAEIVKAQRDIVSGRRGLRHITSASIVAGPAGGIIVAAISYRNIKAGIEVTNKYANMLISDISKDL